MFYHSCYETESRTLSVFPWAAELQRLNKTSILHGEKGGKFIACNVICDKIRTGILLTPLGREEEKERFSIYLNSLAEVCAKMYEKVINNPEADQRLHRNDPFLLRLISGDRPSAEEIEEYCGEANGLEDGHTLRHYIHPDIIRLSEEDRSGRSGFLYTLYLYLLNDRSYGICSEKLHIHRSSFAYRIQKIRKVISGDLNDENVRLSLILSICMYWCLHPEEDPTGISRWMQ